MHRVIDFYRLQIQVMRTWQPSGGSRVRRLLATLIVSIVSLAGVVVILPGVNLVPGAPIIGTLTLAAIVLALLNVLVRPLFLALFAGISVIAVVIATLVFQVATFLALPLFVHDLTVNGILTALIASFVYAAVNTILVAVFSITSDDSFFAILMQQVSAGREGVVRTDQPGLVVVQIDGLAHPILARQIRAGRVPHLSNWVRSGRYRLSGWEALLPPTTPASQAGILHGNNDGIPAFRWYEKGPGRIMVANHPDDAMEVATRISNGEGLCSNDGASVGNLFSGDAARSYITMATIKDKSQGLGQSRTFMTFFASPYNYLGTIVRFVAEMIKENIQARRQRSGPASCPGCTAAGRTRSPGPRPTSASVTCRRPSSSRRCTAARRSSTSTTPTTTRSPTTADPSGPRPSTPSTAWTGRSRRWRRPPRPRRGRTASSSCPTTARPSGRHSSSGTARRSATWSRR